MCADGEGAIFFEKPSIGPGGGQRKTDILVRPTQNVNKDV